MSESSSGTIISTKQVGDVLILSCKLKIHRDDKYIVHKFVVFSGGKKTEMTVEYNEWGHMIDVKTKTTKCKNAEQEMNKLKLLYGV
jgi:hypothetical protein